MAYEQLYPKNKVPVQLHKIHKKILQYIMEINSAGELAYISKTIKDLNLTSHAGRRAVKYLCSIVIDGKSLLERKPANVQTKLRRTSPWSIALEVNKEVYSNLELV